MNRSNHAIATVVAAVLLALVGTVFVRPTAAQQRPRPVAATKWEYRILHQFDENNFNALGAEGWEFAGVVGQIPNYNVPVTLVFKRARP